MLLRLVRLACLYVLVAAHVDITIAEDSDNDLEEFKANCAEYHLLDMAMSKCSAKFNGALELLAVSGSTQRSDYCRPLNLMLLCMERQVDKYCDPLKKPVLYGRLMSDFSKLEEDVGVSCQLTAPQPWNIKEKTTGTGPMSMKS